MLKRRPALPEFPVRRTDPFRPPPQYRPPAGGPVHRVQLAYGGQAWLVSGYQAARTVLADTSFSSDATLSQYPHFPLAPRQPVPGHFLAMDPPAHTRLRRVVAGHFTAAALKPLRPRLLAHCQSLVAAMAAAGSPGDLVSAVAVPFPALVIAELLGVPVADRPAFQAASHELQSGTVSGVQRAAAAARMNRYLTELVHRNRRAPAGEDLLSRLAKAPHPDRLSDAELAGVANLIFVAGMETTTGLLSLTIATLLRERTQAELVSADPARWAEPAVRESLRYWTVVQHGVARVATQDRQIAGQLIRAGEAVVVHLPSANRDPAEYAEPDTFDLTRDARGQLAFGHGPHRCLGAALTQLQVVIAIEVLLRRFPGLRLADPAAALPFQDDRLVYGLHSLPVTWQE